MIEYGYLAESSIPCGLRRGTFRPEAEQAESDADEYRRDGWPGEGLLVDAAIHVVRACRRDGDVLTELDGIHFRAPDAFEAERNAEKFVGWPVGLVGVREIADALSVSRRTVYTWIDRDDFPSPTADLYSGRIWKLEAIRAWRIRADLRPGRPSA